MSDPNSVKLCPSSRCEDGNILLGVVNAEGRIDFIPERIEIDAAFTAVAKAGRPPEQRFRFSSPCLKRGCEKWDGERCGVAKILQERGPDLLPREPAAALPHCSIRQDCRWHGEYGDVICFACSWVITERGNRLEATVEQAQAET
ncbi:MAG: hypothetical protein WA418_10400 [Bradyrhizobium sp.]